MPSSSHGSLRRTGRRALIGAAALVAATLGVPGVAGASPASPQAASYGGYYFLHSTDCYFSVGSCHITLHLVQNGDVLTDPRDPNFHGHVGGNHIRFSENVPCCSEDGWEAVGHTHDGGLVVRGTLYDGLGGSGSFRMTFLGP